jgi:hypothetical protein
MLGELSVEVLLLAMHNESAGQMQAKLPWIINNVLLRNVTMVDLWNQSVQTTRTWTETFVS